MRAKRFLPVLLLALLLTGCATTITNLTPTRQPRNATGLYPVEMEFSSRQQTLRDATVQPYVVIGPETYPMARTLKMANRWETLIPISADKKIVHYHFKVDYEFNRMGEPGKGSKLSGEYSLTILD